MKGERAYVQRLEGIRDRFHVVTLRLCCRPRGRPSLVRMALASREGMWARIDVAKDIAAFDRALGRKAQ